MVVKPDKVEIIAADVLVRNVPGAHLNLCVFISFQGDEHVLYLGGKLHLPLKSFRLQPLFKKLFILKRHHDHVDHGLNKIEIVVEQLARSIEITDKRKSRGFLFMIDRNKVVILVE